MNSETYHEVVNDAMDDLAMPEESKHERRLRRAIEDSINRKAEEGKVLFMTDEEDRMIRAFRAFRSNAKRNGEVFKWQTTMDDRLIVPGDEASLIKSSETVPA